MKLYRVLLSSISASFRYPNMMINNQLSIKSIPYSTLQGLIAAAYGSYEFGNLSFSYIFRYEAIFKDAETIYKFKNDDGKIMLKMFIIRVIFIQVAMPLKESSFLIAI